jgi:hypothetical protein
MSLINYLQGKGTTQEKELLDPLPSPPQQEIAFFLLQ